MENLDAVFTLSMPDGRTFTSEIPVTDTRKILIAASILDMVGDLGISTDESRTPTLHNYEITFEETVIHTVKVAAFDEDMAREIAMSIVEDGASTYQTESAGDMRITELTELK